MAGAEAGVASAGTVVATVGAGDKIVGNWGAMVGAATVGAATTGAWAAATTQAHQGVSGHSQHTYFFQYATNRKSTC